MSNQSTFDELQSVAKELIANQATITERERCAILAEECVNIEELADQIRKNP